MHYICKYKSVMIDLQIQLIIGQSQLLIIKHDSNSDIYNISI
jgi:hypothetical protein